MPEKKIELSGVYKEMEVIQMDTGKVLKWSKLIDGSYDPLIPFGTEIKITLTYDSADFITGSNGIVWATYSQLQVETIKNALLVQNVFSEIRISNLDDKNLYLIFIQNIFFSKTGK